MKQYHYGTFAKDYDIIEVNEPIQKFNKILNRILKKHHVKTVLDMTCGTGEQTIYLHKKGIMHVNQKTYIQDGLQKPKVLEEHWDMQIYTADELKKTLQRNGFEVLSFLDMNGKNLDRRKSLSLVCVARKLK